MREIGGAGGEDEACCTCRHVDRSEQTTDGSLRPPLLKRDGSKLDRKKVQTSIKGNNLRKLKVNIRLEQQHKKKLLKTVFLPDVVFFFFLRFVFRVRHSVAGLLGWIVKNAIPRVQWNRSLFVVCVIIPAVEDRPRCGEQLVVNFLRASLKTSGALKERAASWG